VTATTRRYLVVASLVGVAAIWGATFVMVKDAVSRYPLYAFLALRFGIAVIAFVAVFPSSLRLLRGKTAAVGLLAGVLLTAGYVFQTWGLQGTSASKAAFVTGMFVVITPVLQAVLLRRPPKRWTVAGVALSVVGLWLLSGGDAGGWTAGDTRVLVCAFMYSAQMIVLGSIGREHDARPLTLIQLATVAVVCGAISLAKEPIEAPPDAGVWLALIVTGVLASAVAFAVQTYAQRFISPTRTALILITEPVFGGLFGWLAGERLGVGGLAGAVLILAGMVVAEVFGAKARPGEPVVLEPSVEGPPVPLSEG